VHRLGSVLRFILRSGKRIAVTLVGFALLGAGAIMLITPGPGMVVIIIGLAVLATEYAWAERALKRARERAGQAVRKVRRRTRGEPEAADPEAGSGS
jgi:uncharacterized protein (TIGR02611 family)